MTKRVAIIGAGPSGMAQLRAFESAQKKGHEVKVFFAADGVHLMNCKEIGKIVGQGTGDVKEHLDHLKETNTKIYVSGMSAKARGYDENILKEYNAEFAMPDILIELSLEADSFLSF